MHKISNYKTIIKVFLFLCIIFLPTTFIHAEITSVYNINIKVSSLNTEVTHIANINNNNNALISSYSLEVAGVKSGTLSAKINGRRLNTSLNKDTVKINLGDNALRPNQSASIEIIYQLDNKTINNSEIKYLFVPRISTTYKVERVNHTISVSDDVMNNLIFSSDDLSSSGTNLKNSPILLIWGKSYINFDIAKQNITFPENTLARLPVNIPNINNNNVKDWVTDGINYWAITDNNPNISFTQEISSSPTIEPTNMDYELFDNLNYDSISTQTSLSRLNNINKFDIDELLSDLEIVYKAQRILIDNDIESQVRIGYLNLNIPGVWKNSIPHAWLQTENRNIDPLFYKKTGIEPNIITGSAYLDFGIPNLDITEDNLLGFLNSKSRLILSNISYESNLEINNTDNGITILDGENKNKFSTDVFNYTLKVGSSSRFPRAIDALNLNGLIYDFKINNLNKVIMPNRITELDVYPVSAPNILYFGDLDYRVNLDSGGNNYSTVFTISYQINYVLLVGMSVIILIVIFILLRRLNGTKQDITKNKPQESKQKDTKKIKVY